MVSEDLAYLDPLKIAVEGQIYLSFGGKNIQVAVVVAIIYLLPIICLIITKHVFI